MTKLLFGLLALLNFESVAHANFPKDTQAWPAYNLIGDLNPGFENGTTQWAASGGTYTVSTTVVGEGLRGGQWTPGAASQTLTGPSAAIGSATLQAGRPGVGSCMIQTTSSAHVLEVVDGASAVLGIATVTPSASGFTRASALFTFPNGAGTSVRVRLRSGDTTLVYLDSCYVGPLDGFPYRDTVRLPVEYISNPDAEANADGWATYADAAGAAPVDGTGGSPSVTWARTTTTPLRGNASFLFTKDAVNRQGQGVSSEFTISEADKAKSVAVYFNYQIVSGTYADNDLTVWIYDVTNAQMIQPAGFQIKAMGSGTTGLHVATFQTSATGTQYRLILHVASTSASAYSVEIDKAASASMVGPQNVAYTTPVTDWIDYTPDTGITSSTSRLGKWRRVGDSMEVQAFVTFNAAATGTFSINIPSGYLIDTAKVTNSGTGNVIGFATGADTGAANYTGAVIWLNTTQVRILSQGSNTNIWSTTVPFSWGSTDIISLRFFVPIVGWSSSAQIVSESSEGRVVAARAYLTSGKSLTTANQSTIVWDTSQFDTHGAYSTSTGEYTVKIPGKYRIGAALLSDASTAVRGAAIAIYKNTTTGTPPSGGTILADNRGWKPSTTASHRVTIAASTTADLVAGDKISVSAVASDTNFTTTTGADACYFEISLIQGSSTILGGETVAARFTRGSTVIGTSPTKMVFTNTDYLYSGSFSSGEYTVPVSGLYRINASVESSPAASSNGVALLYIYKKPVGGSFANVARIGRNYIPSGVGASSCGAGEIRLLAGETVAIYASFPNSMAAFDDPLSTWFEIERIGNY